MLANDHPFCALKKGAGTSHHGGGTHSLEALVTSLTRRLRNAGFTEPQADAAADAIHDATRHLATKADLYRALWLQGPGIIAAVAAMLSAPFAVIELT